MSGAGDFPHGLKLAIWQGLNGPGIISTGDLDPGDEILSVVNLTPTPESSEYSWAFARGVQYIPGTVGGVVMQITEPSVNLSSKFFIALVKKGSGFVP